MGEFGKAGKTTADSYRKQCEGLFKYATKFRDPSFPATPSKASSVTSNHNNISTSKNDIEDNQSKVNSGDGDVIKLVNNTKNMHINNSKQSPKNAQAKSIAASADSKTES